MSSNIVSKPGELDYLVIGGSYSSSESARFGDQGEAFVWANEVSQKTRLPASIYFDGEIFAHVIARAA